MYWPIRGQYCVYWPIRGQHSPSYSRDPRVLQTAALRQIQMKQTLSQLPVTECCHKVQGLQIRPPSQSQPLWRMKLDLMVDRVKPWFMVYGSWFMVHGFVLGSVYDCVHGLVHDSCFISFYFKGLLPELCTQFTFNQGSLNVPFIMFFLNMVNYPVFFPLMSTLTWDTFLILRGT